MNMRQVLGSAVVYFAVVFVAAFALGALRVTAIAPRLGELMAVLIEVPIVLGLSWFVCSRVVRYFEVPNAWAPRLAMGTVAFLLLMIAEPGIAVFGFGSTLSNYFAAFKSTAAIIGLLGQIAFALIPITQSLTSSKAAPI